MTENHPSNLYLVRHGEAREAAEDPQRSLTENGRKAVQQVASILGKQNLHVDQIWHSGKTRARETAEILAQHLSPSQGTVAISGLAPNDDVHPIAEMIIHESSTTMLVGHLPFLSRLVSLLLLNNPESDILHILPSSVLYLNRTEGIWKLNWMLTPDLVYY
jgi:phosphohistidine phosphatase